MGLRRRLRRTSSVSSDDLSVHVLSQHEDQPPKGVIFAKKKKPDEKWFQVLQVLFVIVLICATAYIYYFFSHFHFHLTKFYAHHVNDHHALHRMGHHMLKDNKNATAAFEYFRRSADQGHPESAYNLAAGHLSGYKTDVKKGKSHCNSLTSIFYYSIILYDRRSKAITEICCRQWCN